ncbi:hypothetical protein ACFOHS_08990 [Jhaorihella thermophila]
MPVVISMKTATQSTSESTLFCSIFLRRWRTSCFSKTRPWSKVKGEFVDENGAEPEDADGEDVVRALPLTFIGYYDRKEDDFVGTTYFAHPVKELGEEDEHYGKPFAGLLGFPREWKNPVRIYLFADTTNRTPRT